MPAVVTDTVRAVIVNPGMQRFLNCEGDPALITGEHPDPDRAGRVINALLPGRLVSRKPTATPQFPR